MSIDKTDTREQIVTDKQLIRLAVKHNLGDELSYETGPYDVSVPTVDYRNFVDELLATAIKSPKAAEFQMNKVKPIIGALMFLIETKRYKDKHGKTQEYQVMRGEAWSAAEQALKEAQSE